MSSWAGGIDVCTVCQWSRVQVSPVSYYYLYSRWNSTNPKWWWLNYILRFNYLNRKHANPKLDQFFLTFKFNNHKACFNLNYIRYERFSIEIEKWNSCIICKFVIDSVRSELNLFTRIITHACVKNQYYRSWSTPRGTIMLFSIKTISINKFAK